MANRLIACVHKGYEKIKLAVSDPPVEEPKNHDSCGPWILYWQDNGYRQGYRHGLNMRMLALQQGAIVVAGFVLFAMLSK